MIRGVAIMVAGVATIGALLFVSAGRLDLPWCWAYVLGWGVYAGASVTLAVRTNPDLVAERMKPPSDREPWTRRLATVPALGHLVVAGLDVGRFGWSAVPTWGHLLGFFLLTAGWVFIAWVFVANRFASSAVRIQTDRNQTVITTGPYALVRHPMYLGLFLILAGAGPAVGSLWAGATLLPLYPIFIRRTLIEDRMLHEELDGYRQYAARTRWRIVPGIF